MAQNDSGHDLIQRIKHSENSLRKYLDDLGRRRWKWLLPDHPVRTKNLEKIAGHLQTILVHLESNDELRIAAESRSPSLISLLDQVQHPKQLSFGNAWEIADLLELESLRLADDSSLYILLKAQQIPDPSDAHNWEKHFPLDYLQALQAGFASGQFREKHFRDEARLALEYLQQSRIGEYRRDRAKANLRGNYSIVMAIWLAVQLAGWCWAYTWDADPADEVKKALVIAGLAGATGSVLSRVVKLGKQPLHAEADGKTPEPPLGIRTLLSGWRMFFAQTIIGGTAAIVLYFVFSSGLLQLGQSKQLGPAALGLVCFLAGFSEPFFIGTLDKIAGKAGASPG